MSDTVPPFLPADAHWLHTLLQHLPDPVWLKDTEGVYLYCNHAFMQMFGVADNVIIGKRDIDLVDAELADFFRSRDLLAIHHDRALINDEWVTFAHDGHRRLLQVIKTPLYNDGQLVGVLGIGRDITNLHEVQQQLAEQERTLRYVMEATGEGVWDWDARSGILQHNNRWSEITGIANNQPAHSLDEFIAQVHQEDLAAVTSLIARCLRGEAPYYSEHRICRADGGIVWVMDRGNVVERDEQGLPTRMVGSIKDITTRKQAEEALRASEARFRALFAASADGILVMHGQHVVDANPEAARLFGCTIDTLLHSTPCELSPPLQPDGRDAAMLAEHYLQVTLEQGLLQCEWRFQRPDGSQFDAELQLTVAELGNDRHILVNCRDITQKKRDSALIWQQANFDQLTGLPNRYMLQSRLEQEIARCQRDDQRLALLLLDLDHFKEVNDTLGHRAGDELLQSAARRLQACVRHIDTVARLGGDEFTVIISSLEHAQQAGELAERILQALATPYHLGSDVAYLSVSIGITVCPDDSSEMESLLKNADQAMYAAKGQGRNRSCFFTPSMQQAAQTRVRLGKDLRHALAAGQFHVYYQPILALPQQGIVGAEALLRWQHPERGWVSPAEFIPLAEDSGLVIELGDWVCEQVCGQLRQWRQLVPQLHISVNVSPIQFFAESGNLARWTETLTSYGLPGDSLVLEITERLLLDNREQVSTLLAALRDFGIRVSLDDFGTGYSSLSYLKKFDIDYLKIDQAFVRHLETDASDRALCEAMIAMAHRLGMHVVAEGIEQQAHLSWLAAAGCDFGQGYLFAAAMPAEAFEQLLRQQARH